MAGADQRCAWCHGTDGELRQLTLPATPLGAAMRLPVHPRHQEALRRLHGRAARHWRTLLWTLAGWLLLVVVFEVVLLAASRDLGLVGIGLATVVLGAVLAAVPLPTPQTVRLWGARRAVAATRVAGAALAAVGLAVACLPWLLTG